MPEFKPVRTPSGLARKWIVAGVAAFIVAAFLFAYFVNLPEWR